MADPCRPKKKKAEHLKCDARHSFENIMKDRHTHTKCIHTLVPVQTQAHPVRCAIHWQAPLSSRS